MLTLLNAIMSGPGVGQPADRSRRTRRANTITVRGSAAMVAIIERVIENNDKPRAEIVIDVEILEVNRTRAKQYGLNLSQLRDRRQSSRRRARRRRATSGGTAGRRGRGRHDDDDRRSST